jgi:hypothetical protein
LVLFPFVLCGICPLHTLFIKGTEGVSEADGKGDKQAATIGFRHWSMVLLITTKPHEKRFQHRLMHDSSSSNTASGVVLQVKG